MKEIIIETKQDKNGTFVPVKETYKESCRTPRPRVHKSYNVRRQLSQSSNPSLTGVKQVDDFLKGFGVGLDIINQFRKYIGIL